MTRIGASGSAPPPRPRIGRRRKRLRRTIAILVILGASGTILGGALWWLNRPRVHRPGEDMPAITRSLAHELPVGAPDIRFVDITVESALDTFTSFRGARTSRLPEDMGPGAAWGDFDNDGDDDVFIVSGGGPLSAAPADRAPCVLFENRGDGTFAQSEALPALRIIGLAAAWGDCDGDGWLDLIVTGYDSLLLFRNRQGSLVRDDAFPSLPGFWAGAAWGDFDNDRSLDLYVCGYVQYEEREADRAHPSRQFGAIVPYTLNPSSYEPQRNLLFHNNGDGTFREVAESLGVANAQGRSLGAIWHDFDQDGWLDLYVANDVSDNAFYRNTGGGFEDISHAAWVADYRGAMGLAVGDYDRDGDDDIFVTHWVAQENALYTSLLKDVANLPGDAARGSGASSPDGNQSPVRFVDDASMHGLGQIALQKIGWGAQFADFDADGWLDLVVANGSTFETDDEPKRLKPQPSFLFWSREGRVFHDLGRFSEVFRTPHVSRGLALSDYDGDGDQDILFVDLDGGVRLLRNDTAAGSWMQVRLRSRDRDGALTGFGDGATVEITVDGVTLRRSVGSGSYLSQSSRTLHFGLGAAGRVERLEVRWVAGGTDVHTDLAANALWEIREGEAKAIMIRPDARHGDVTDAAEAAGAGGALSDRERVSRFWSKQRAAMRAMKIDGDPATAIVLFEEALVLDPTHEDARYYLANCLASVGEPEAAIRELEELIRTSPRSHRGLKRLGILLAMRGRSPRELREASAVLERALAINPEETGVLTALGDIAVMLGEHELARQRFEWVSRTNPRAVGALFLRAYVAWKAGDDEQARTLLGLAAEARGEDFKPGGMTAEGDVDRRMHSDHTPLSRFWQDWDGAQEPDDALRVLDEFVAAYGDVARRAPGGGAHAASGGEGPPMTITRTSPRDLGTFLPLFVAAVVGAHAAVGQEGPDPHRASIRVDWDSDHDGLPDHGDACPLVVHEPAFDSGDCAPMDLDPDNDPQPECKARERVAQLLLTSGRFVTNMAFAVVKEGDVHFADAFEYIGQGQFVHDPAGVHRLYRIGSTSKSVTAVAAKILQEHGALSMEDFVNDDDATQQLSGGQRTLRHLLTHQGAFRQDVGAVHLFCYLGDLGAFWRDPDDLVSPHYDSPTYGNLGGGYEYSAFNYSLAGAYLAHRTGASYEQVIQTRVFDAAGMCTATLDGARAVGTPIGLDWAVSQGAVMHIGPYINLFSKSDPRCEDNYYSSDALPGDPYEWLYYHLDEADGEARDPAGGVIASAIDMAHFARALLDSYRWPGGLLSQEGVRDLWGATTDLGCFPNCPYERYYAVGFFTDSLPGAPVTQVGHGGSRAGYASAFVLRPEANLAVCVLANADVSTVAMSDLAKAILDDFAE